MIIQLEKNISKTEREKLFQKLESLKINARPVKTNFKEYIVGIPSREFDLREIGNLKGIADIHRVSDSYKMVSRKWKLCNSVIDLGDGIKIGNGELTIMSGPCAIESEEQIESIVGHLMKNNIRIMRGGVYKPRSSPSSFRGLGIDGLKLFYHHCL